MVLKRHAFEIQEKFSLAENLHTKTFVVNINQSRYIEQININGGISFGKAYDSYTSTPFPLEDEPPIIASYLTDLHTERNHSLVAEIYHREDTTPEILQVSNNVKHCLVTLYVAHSCGWIANCT